MEMKVLGSLTKGNGIHALASADLFHEITGIANSAPPITSLGRREIQRGLNSAFVNPREANLVGVLGPGDAAKPRVQSAESRTALARWDRDAAGRWRRFPRG